MKASARLREKVGVEGGLLGAEPYALAGSLQAVPRRSKEAGGVPLTDARRRLWRIAVALGLFAAAIILIIIAETRWVDPNKRTDLPGLAACWGPPWSWPEPRSP